MKPILRLLGLADGEERTGRTPAIDADTPTVIGAGVTIKGEIRGEGGLTVLGQFDGDIVLGGSLYVGPDGRVDANITAAGVVIAGVVRGNLAAGTRVDILPTGSLTGTVKSQSFAAAHGSTVKGEVWVEPPTSPGAAA